MGKHFYLCYETSGNPENPCILLIPGLGGQLIHWPREFIRTLVERGFYVVSYDSRDAGQSKSFKELGEPSLQDLMQGKLTNIPYTLEDMANDAIALLDELKIKKAHIAGMSMGGEIAQLAAINHPDRVISLTCIASTSGEKDLPPPSDAVNKLMMTPNSDLEHKIELYKIYTHPKHFHDTEFRELAQALADRTQDPTGFVRQIIAKAVSGSRREALTQLKMPTLIIHGDYDPVFPIEHGRRLAELIPHAKLTQIAEFGHTLPKEFCEEVANDIAVFNGKNLHEKSPGVRRTKF